MNFDLKAGRAATLDNLLRPGAQAKTGKLCKAQLRKYYGGAEQEYKRVQTMLSGLTGNFPIMRMSAESIGKFAEMAKSDSLMAETVNELRDRLRSIKGPEDYLQMSQAYEAYAEANVCFELARPAHSRCHQFVTR